MENGNIRNNEITNYGSWKEWGIYLVQQVKSMSRTQDKLENKIENLTEQIKEMDKRQDERLDDMKIEFVEEITKLKERTNRKSALYGVIGTAIAVITYIVIKLLTGGGV